jgi:GH25 family lysozyme M1 (1,4-beta-N-acetylmuramidase)
MALDGIDTASYQAGLNPAKVPMDFNIVKATQGVAYINPDFARMAKATVDAGKLIGIYHYASGNDPVKEADFFLRNIPGYIGKAILCLDWEGEQNPAFGKSDVSWCKKFCDRVYEKTGVRCFIYMSKSVCHAHDWKAVAKDYPLWCAQYASMNRTGYQDRPWTDSSGFGAWDKPTIYQYSSGGQLAGWSRRLDLDLAYLTADQWRAWAKAKPKKEVVILYPEKTDADLAVEILFDAYGTGDKRKKALAGRYDGAQADVERLLSGNKTSLLMAIQQYLKRHGADKLI